MPSDNNNSRSQRLLNASVQLHEVLVNIQNSVFEDTDVDLDIDVDLTSDFYECKEEMLGVLVKWLDTWESNKYSK